MDGLTEIGEGSLYWQLPFGANYDMTVISYKCVF